VDTDTAATQAKNPSCCRRATFTPADPRPPAGGAPAPRGGTPRAGKASPIGVSTLARGHRPSNQPVLREPLGAPSATRLLLDVIAANLDTTSNAKTPLLTYAGVHEDRVWLLRELPEAQVVHAREAPGSLSPRRLHERAGQANAGAPSLISIFIVSKIGRWWRVRRR
jgi:hypothetical protein